MTRRRICVVTGSRADYGLLYWLMKDIDADPDCELLVAATGAHLSPAHGMTSRAIEDDGFRIDAKVDILLGVDSPEATAKSMGRGVMGFADEISRLAPDWIVLLGDRYEIFAAAQVALIMRIPIAHIAGGDSTEGAYDEAMRHGITKMAHLHFVTNEVAAKRVRQLGEDPRRVFNTGSPGIDYIRRLKLLDRASVESEMGFRLRKRNFLVTFHPTTLGAAPAAEEFSEVLKALEAFDPRDFGIVFTLPNADTGARSLVEMIDAFTARNENSRAFPSLGQKLYLSLMSAVDVVVGNSSSGLYEAPSFGKPTVNVGDRQKGRLQAVSVINCKPLAADIARALQDALRRDCRGVHNPYGEGDASRRILSEIKRVADPRALLMKHFHDLGNNT
jgi:UDP-N-acetylglucosamine 2-epimerase (non-hydrolysing)/GDP/UDP-N,N'-diacetylbacillosamine 2-epimerase (hydrolysing)